MGEAEFSIAGYRQYLAQRKIMACCCLKCGQIFLPPRPICPTCHGQNMQWVALSGQGVLVAFTSIAVAPAVMVQQGYGRHNPYISGFVALNEGPTVPARIQCRKQPIRIGTPMMANFMDQCPNGEKQVTLVFRPRTSTDG